MLWSVANGYGSPLSLPFLAEVFFQFLLFLWSTLAVLFPEFT
jgi:hypothetical protein